MKWRWHWRLKAELLEARQMLSAGPVVVTEIMYHPVLTSDEVAAGFKENDLEFIELENTTPVPVSLAGISVSDGVTFTFGEMTLNAGQFVVIVNNPQAFALHYGSGPMVAGQYKGSLKNKGEHLLLADSAGGTILDFSFDSAWYSATDGGGHSLSIVDPTADAAAWNQPANWQPSTRVGGSPGFDDGIADPRPKNLTATVLSSRQVALSWEPPTGGGSPIQEYGVYRDDQFLGRTQRTSFSDTTVFPDATYAYRVSAVHVDGTQYSSNPTLVTIEAIGGDPAFAPGVARGLVQIDGLQELSGLVASRHNSNVLWTHNDGPQDTVHAINTQGQWVGWLQLPGAPSQDVEDIAVGPGPEAGVDYLYIGDIGGNNDDRTEVQVFRVPEPAMAWNEFGQENIVRYYDTLTLRYPGGQGFNAETLLSDPLTGDLFVLTKEPQISHVYRVAASQLSTGHTVTMELVGQVDFPVASAGDISPTGTEIVIRNEQLAWLFVRGEGQSVADALSGRPLETPLIGRPDEPNGEGITFSGLDRGYYTISEGPDPPLYFFRRTSPVHVGDANRDGVFDSSDMVQVFQAGEYEDGISLNSTWDEGDWNGDGDFDSADLVLAFTTGLYELKPQAVGSQLAAAVDWLFTQDQRKWLP